MPAPPLKGKELNKARQVLATQMGPNDAGAATVREYLVELLVRVWDEGESFSGKRPFGNSGWEHEVYRPLVEAGFIVGTFDEDGWLDDVDDLAADELIGQAIRELGVISLHDHFFLRSN